jgi:hypothetical protein
MTGQRSNTVVVSHLAFGTLSLWSINAPRWRRSWNVWISCSQDGRQGSQHLIRFSVGHFALAQGNPGDIVRGRAEPRNSVLQIIPSTLRRRVCSRRRAMPQKYCQFAGLDVVQLGR